MSTLPDDQDAPIITLESSGIDLDMIQKIHRGGDSYVSLGHKPNGKWGDLGGLPADKLDEYLPDFLPWICQDSYMSVCSFWNTKPYSNKLTGYPAPLRDKCELRYLTACYIDLDVGRPNDKEPCKRMSFGAAVGKVIEYQDAGIIPTATIIARSGRGAYLFWLLKGDDGSSVQKAFPNHIRTHEAINRELVRRLEPVGADIKAVPSSQMLRIPGSFNTKAQRRVEYVFFADSKISPFFYTLKQLAEFLDIGMKDRHELEMDFVNQHTLRQAQNPGTAPKRKNGPKGKGLRRAGDVVIIEREKGGFNQGKRRFSLVYFAEFMKDAGIPKDDTMKDVRKLANNCNPPYPSDDNDKSVSDIVTEAYTGKSKLGKTLNNDRLADFFGVAPEQANEWNLKSIVPAIVSARRERDPPPQKLKRTIRQNALRRYLKDNPGSIPPLRTLVRAMADMGIKTNRDTVSKDLRELEDRNLITRPPGRRPGRKRKSDLPDNEKLIPPLETP